MRMKFSTRLVLVNIAVAVVLAAVIGFIVTQGLMLSSLKDSLNTLSVTASESEVIIRQSILSLATDETPEEVYVQNGDFYATRIASVYGVNVLLFDTDGNLVGTNAATEDYAAYAAYASDVLAANKQGYVYTGYGDVEYILFCSPIAIRTEAVGAVVLLYPTVNINSIVRNTASLFLFAGVVASVIAAVIFYFSYRRMTKPINQLVEFTQTAGESERIAFPDIGYFANDEIGLLVDGFKELTVNINEKINEIDLEREKMNVVFSSMQDGVLTVNESGDVVLVNKRMSEMFPSHSDMRKIIPDFESTLQTIISGKPEASSEFAYESKNYYLNAKRLNISEQSPGVLFVISDITAIKKVEEEQNRFISSVSHELKTPLTTIIGYTDLLERRGFGDKNLTDKALTTMKSEGNRLLRLVNDLLSINRFHSYDFELIFTDIDPDKLLCDVAAEMNVTAAEYDMIIAYDSSPLPEIKGDYDRLKQTLINIIDNSIKYSHLGDIIKLSAIPHEDILEITVRDFGDGIPEDKQEKVFETFYRVEEDRSRISMKGGFGLGLSIVKNIIERHNGSVSIESEVGSGTLVVIKLPVKQAAREELSDE